MSIRVRAQQFLLALVFLTRLPLGRLLPPRVLPLAESAWAFPLVGAIIGAIASLPLLLPGPPLLTATLSVALAVWLTGALHEDALADFADAAGGNTPEDRLRIMRDSRIGSYGVMALIVSTLLRIAALGVLGPLALIAAASTGRAAIVFAMVALPPARSDGLGRAAGRPGLGGLAVSALIAALFLLPAGLPAFAAAGVAAIVGAWVIFKAKQWLGGQTGDVLGTMSLVAETAVLVVFALFREVTAS
ncbi:adenosylcobinamide-GDP ribazoletransferase [Paracoccus caeni]|uniref:Adenosylcobinamide-GDP ribazoletransferase n=1 Tax=Paracoccus caeni TaxID=657651 RepID=A0A934VZ88_9RHOB|nr:adenosylcobinamide-GDP ribazoletransferase [Paracoccus caeni]MBK4215580.1 adenosylcobinamide-GDP ribazoletransferase [Paracoccus caeni]